MQTANERGVGIHRARLMGHMSRAMLERYSHIRMAAKREAVAEVALRQKERNSQAVPVVTQITLVQ